MARDLRGIIRYRRYQLDEARRALGERLAAAADLGRRAQALETEIVGEQRIAAEKPEEAGFIYGQYAARAIQRRERLASAVVELEREISEAQEGVRLEFRELKVFEIAQEARDASEEQELRRGEQAVLDEIGGEVFRRRND